MYDIQINNFEPERQFHYWYGGMMAKITSALYPGYRFEIEACGDVYINLYDKQTGELLDYVKDKNNSGSFYDLMAGYFKTDNELEQAICDEHPLYKMEIDHNNWWELVLYTPENEFVDLMCNLDADKLTDAIEEAIEAIPSCMEWINENTKVEAL